MPFRDPSERIARVILSEFERFYYRLAKDSQRCFQWLTLNRCRSMIKIQDQLVRILMLIIIMDTLTILWKLLKRNSIILKKLRMQMRTILMRAHYTNLNQAQLLQLTKQWTTSIMLSNYKTYREDQAAQVLVGLSNHEW